MANGKMLILMGILTYRRNNFYKLKLNSIMNFRNDAYFYLLAQVILIVAGFIYFLPSILGKNKKTGVGYSYVIYFSVVQV